MNEQRGPEPHLWLCGLWTALQYQVEGAGGGEAAVTPGVPVGQRLSSAQRRRLFPDSHQGQKD